MKDFGRTERTRIRRKAQRACHDRATTYAILDEGLVCHVGFALDVTPFVIPTLYWRDGDKLYFHGSSASRSLRALGRSEVEACVTVTLLDGLVLARSAFHHSVNYRSVMVFGRARLVEDPEDKMRALERLVESIVPGRWQDIRPPNAQEMKATAVLVLPLEEVSVKIRSGGPVDEEPDYNLPVWAGVVPFRLVGDAPETDPLMRHDTPVPDHATGVVRPLRRAAE